MTDETNDTPPTDGGTAVLDFPGHTGNVGQSDEAADETNKPAERTSLSISGYEANIIVAACERRKDDLEKESKKLEDLGYFKESRALKGDAGLIRDTILPTLRPKMGELLATPEECRAGIANAFLFKLRSTLMLEFTAGRKQAKVDLGEEIGPDEVRRVNVDAFAGWLAVRIEKYGRTVADRAWAAGRADRQNAAEEAMIQSLDALRLDENQ